jgi:hypothetical protein
MHRHPSRPRPRHPRNWPPGSWRASSSRLSGSVSSMPTPSTSSGAPCNAGSAGGSTPLRPTWLSLGWSPTEPPAADHYPAETGQPSTPPTSIAHQVVSLDPLRGCGCLGVPGRGCAWGGVRGRSDPSYHWPRVPCG